MDNSQKQMSGERGAGDGKESALPNSQFLIPNSAPTPDREAQFAVSCPFCGGADVELFSLFGSQLLTTEYYCNNCRTVFENVKR